MTKTSGHFEELLEYLHRTRGFDFSGYKRASLERRICKRMGQVGLADFDTYVDHLEVHPDEFAQLFNTILINVTGFFRDPEAWKKLFNDALPPLLAARGERAPIRAWSAGCASGQEAYTIAMGLAELIGVEAVCARAKIYATDIDDEALEEARRASYGARDLEALPPGYADKYFEANGARHELRKDLRRCVIFGRNDLIRDAPISRIDLITCRNTMMYMNAETQARVLSRLDFALNGDGLLMLGKAEMLLSHATLFSPIDLKRRIFSRVDRSPRPERLASPAFRHDSPSRSSVTPHDRLRELALDAGPVANVVVDGEGKLILINQRAREIFALSSRDVGRPLQDLEFSYRPVELRSLIEQAYTEGRIVTVKDVERLRVGGEPTFFDVQVTPLIDRAGVGLGAQIAFVEITLTTRLTRELRHANHELETAYEELQSAGEELETTTEELQSTVEELETTNEELQSTNEELQHLNDELRKRSEAAADSNAFLEAILGTVRGAVIVVDRELAVEIWNAAAENLWGLCRDEAVGKNLMALDIGFPVERLRTPLRACFAGETIKDAMLDGTNRRGRAVRVAVSCTRLVGKAETRGALVVLEETGVPLPNPRDGASLDETP